MNDAIEFVRDIRHCAEPWTWNLLEEDGEITYSPDRDARTGWIRYKCKTDKAFTEVLKTLEYVRGCFCRDNGYPRRVGLRGRIKCKEDCEALTVAAYYGYSRLCTASAPVRRGFLRRIP